jgi:hypothetical protein
MKLFDGGLFMDTNARSIAIRTVLVAALCGLTVFGLAACKDTASTKPTPTVSATSKHSPSARPTQSMSTPAPTVSSATPAAPAVKGTAIGVDCNGLLSPQVIYDFNPNFSLQSGFTPKSGTDASKAIGYQGLACSWINQTSSDLIIVSVAHPSASDLASLKATASSGIAASGLGNAAYFKASAGVGELQVFNGPFWITMSSVAFGTADDARDLASAAIATAK